MAGRVWEGWLVCFMPICVRVSFLLRDSLASLRNSDQFLVEVFPEV